MRSRSGSAAGMHPLARTDPTPPPAPKVTPAVPRGAGPGAAPRAAPRRPARAAGSHAPAGRGPRAAPPHPAPPSPRQASRLARPLVQLLDQVLELTLDHRPLQLQTRREVTVLDVEIARQQ